MVLWFEPQYKELSSVFGTTGDRVHSARALPPIRRLIDLTSLRSERQQWPSVGLRHQVKCINLIFDLFFRESKLFSLKNVWIASAVITFIHLEDFSIKIMHVKQEFVVKEWTMVSQMPKANTRLPQHH